MEEFEGGQWFVSNLNNKMIESTSNKGTWYNLENDFSNANVNYHQTFFLRGNDDLPMVTGYRSLQVMVNDEQTDDALLASGASYRVISSVPEHTPEPSPFKPSVPPVWPGVLDSSQGREQSGRIAPIGCTPLLRERYSYPAASTADRTPSIGSFAGRLPRPGRLRRALLVPWRQRSRIGRGMGRPRVCRPGLPPDI